MLPSIPLFALAGIVMARGGAPERLTRLVRAWIGWAPGGSSIATVVACAFFTAITGASGVTILALGGLLYPILVAAHHKKEFSLGLVTASGSVGLLFFPSVPVILYAVCAGIGFNRLFAAALLPGILLLVILVAFSMWSSEGNGRDRPDFDVREIATATWIARGDLLLPILIIGGYFSGLMTLVEVAALAALWAIVLETVLHRSLGARDGLPEAFVETAVVMGALIAVIGLALGLYGYLVDALIPTRVAEWVTGIIESKWVFLLVLNLLLLLVGALMDIYSAIVVVVPLLVPIAALYGLHPAHVGVVFLANLELGYLTPPVGMNLFLSSLTFERPLLKVWRAVLPFLAIFAAWVILITYVPWLSSGFAEWILS
jgi:tripartite ATP-independent transporter DctM subunit